MICVSLAEKSVEAVCAALPLYAFAEIRLDAVDDLTEAAVKKIFSSHPRLIAAFRPGRISEKERIRQLTAAVAAGAAYVDIEISADPDEIRKIISTARAHACRVIVSLHDYERTPLRAYLEEIRRQGFEAGADIVKIACLSRGEDDNARLLSLLDYPKPIVVLGMGPAGKVTRIVAPLLGAPFTYAAPAAGRETAPGQFEAALIRRTWEAWNNA